MFRAVSPCAILDVAEWVCSPCDERQQTKTTETCYWFDPIEFQLTTAGDQRTGAGTGLRYNIFTKGRPELRRPKKSLWRCLLADTR